MDYFRIEGGNPLSGDVVIGGSKNAAVALIAASLLNRGTTTLTNVPAIEEVNRWIEIVESIGVTVLRKDHTLTLTPPATVDLSTINRDAAQKTRSVVLLLGALARRGGARYAIPQSGGCKLGTRTVRPHFLALQNFGITVDATADDFCATVTELHAAERFALYESGDTVTENVLFAAAQCKGTTEVRFASPNYMVQEVCFFLQSLGVRIDGVGTTTLHITGVEHIAQDVTYAISEDPIEAMFFIALAATTKSELVIRRVPWDFVELEMTKLAAMGLRYRIERRYAADNGRTLLVDLHLFSSNLTALPEKIEPRPYPGINIDNLPFFVPVAAVAEGRTLIHDWVYENRAIYYSELNRLGARITLLDPHRVYVEGPTMLSGAEVMCPPALRPPVIILIAMCAAKGTSILRGIYPILRGYERLEERLTAIGAKITCVKEC